MRKIRIKMQKNGVWQPSDAEYSYLSGQKNDIMLSGFIRKTRHYRAKFY